MDDVEETVETRSIARSDAESSSAGTIIWPFGIKITAAEEEYSIVLKKNGAEHGSYSRLSFEITGGPPNYKYDVQIVRSDASSLAADVGGPDDAWRSDSRPDKRSESVFFSSLAAGDDNTLDGSGNANYEVPLRWWRDMAAIDLKQWDDYNARPRNPHLKFYYRVIAFNDEQSDLVYSKKDGKVSEAPKVILNNNLLRFRVHGLRFYQDGANKWRRFAKITHYVREANTTNMYNMVQWKKGGRSNDAGAVAPGVVVKDYDQQHASTYPSWQIDRVHKNPRYWDGTPKIAGNGLSAYFTDAVSCSPFSNGTAMSLKIDFVSNIHINADIPAEVTIDAAATTILANGSIGVYRGVISNAHARPLRRIPWSAKMRVWKDGAGVLQFQAL